MSQNWELARKYVRRDDEYLLPEERLRARNEFSILDSTLRSDLIGQSYLKSLNAVRNGTDMAEDRAQAAHFFNNANSIAGLPPAINLPPASPFG